MKKANKKDTVNLFFSAFLVIAFIVCAYFFTQFTNTLQNVAGSIITVLIYVVFGLLVFYATRVGDGKAIKRFSLVTLIVLDIPSLYIIIASLAPGMPLNSVFASTTGGLSVIVTLACVALGYGIPYTFLSGFELEDENAPKAEAVDTPVEGGIEADLEIDSADDAANADEAETDEAVADNESTESNAEATEAAEEQQ